jgi:hypothetical protein
MDYNCKVQCEEKLNALITNDTEVSPFLPPAIPLVVVRVVHSKASFLWFRIAGQVLMKLGSAAGRFSQAWALGLSAVKPQLTILWWHLEARVMV